MGNIGHTSSTINGMEEGQIIITSPGARGLIIRVTDEHVSIRWITHEDGQPNDSGGEAVGYPTKDIYHSLASGFLTLSDSDDPNMIFLMRKYDVHS